MVRTILKERKCVCGHLPLDHRQEDFDPDSLDIFMGAPEPCTLCACGGYEPAARPYLSLVPPYGSMHRVVPYYLGFDCKKFTEGVRWEAMPMIPFRMKGFIVWGVTVDTKITLFQVGNTMALIGSRDPVPAIAFQAGYSFEEFKQLIEDKTRAEWNSPMFQGVLTKFPEVLARQLIDAPALTPAVSLKVMINGPIEQMAVWGIAEDKSRSED